jgi:hypothetical protein
VFGIPLTLILLSALVRRLMVPASALLSLLENKLGEFSLFMNLIFNSQKNIFLNTVVPSSPIYLIFFF